MDYEKKYKDALKKSKEFYILCKKCGAKDTVNFLEEAFSELKESEDERIRNKLVELFKDMEWDDSILHDYELEKEKTIAWLEKQVSPQMVADAYLRGCNDTEKKWLEKQCKHKVWTDNDYDSVKSIEYLLHELDNHNFDDWFNSLKERIK